MQTEFLHYLYFRDIQNRAIHCFLFITEEDLAKKVCLAGLGSIVVIAAISLALEPINLEESVIVPAGARFYCQLADDAIRGIWNKTWG